MSTAFENCEIHWGDYNNGPSQLHQLAVSVTSKLTIAEVNHAIMAYVDSQIKPAIWGVVLCDPDQELLRFEMIIGAGTESLQGAVCSIDDGIVGEVFRTTKTIEIDAANLADYPQGFFANSENFGIQNGIAIPIVHGLRPLGVLVLLNLPSPLNPTQHVELAGLSDFVAIAIDNARQLHRVRELSVTDDVTSLYNARYLDQALEQEYSRSKRYGTPISVIFIDLDYFKNVNDNFGHLVGSEVLRETANILRQSLRVTDIATRYGGDEFVLVLPETSQAEALVVAQRCCDAMRAHTFGVRHGADCKVTASFGLATLPDDTSEKIDLIRLSDQAMYFVKEHDRDNIATVSQMRAGTVS